MCFTRDRLEQSKGVSLSAWTVEFIPAHEVSLTLATRVTQGFSRFQIYIKRCIIIDMTPFIRYNVYISPEQLHGLQQIYDKEGVKIAVSRAEQN